MDAAARADSTTVINFTPMALGAYAQLDSVTNDERYHAAVLHAQVGQIAEAKALADTMLLRSPGPTRSAPTSPTSRETASPCERRGPISASTTPPSRRRGGRSTPIMPR